MTSDYSETVWTTDSGVKLWTWCSWTPTLKKTESVNRTYQKTNPKTVTWTRNFSSRIHSGVHLRNNSLAKSVQDRMMYNGISPSPRVIAHLKAEDKRNKQRCRYNNSAKHRLHLYHKKRNIYRLYDKRNGESPLRYKKAVELSSSLHNDHNYFKCK